MKVLLWIAVAVVVFVVFVAWWGDRPEVRQEIHDELVIEECRKAPDYLGACALLEERYRKKYGRAP